MTSDHTIVPRCAICGSRFLELLSEGKIVCPRCDTPFHECCWSYNNNVCARYACDGTTINKTQASTVDSVDFATAAIAGLSRYLRRGFGQIHLTRTMLYCLPLTIVMLCTLSPLAILFLLL